MQVNERILSLARANSGMITARQLAKLGIPRGNLQPLLDEGLLEKASRGVYVLPWVWEDELLCVQEQYKRGVFSHDTALFLHGYSDRTPIKYTMTFPAHYNLTNPRRSGVICYRTKDAFYNLGVTTVKTPGGHAVQAYGVEKTLCDLLRPRSSVDIQIVTAAFKQYAASRAKDIPALSEYSKALGVEKKLRAYLEVLL